MKFLTRQGFGATILFVTNWGFKSRISLKINVNECVI